jgi:DNA-binding transcriptional LysR family regulator
MADLSLTGLRVLREVASRGSFTAAAESLGYTQSAISRQVAALESTTGAALFERGARGVRLTDAGTALLRRAETVLDEVERAQREIEGFSPASAGRLRVGAFPTAAASLVPRALSALRERRPGIQVSLRDGSTPTLLRRVASGNAEVAVLSVLPGGQRPGDRGVAIEHLTDDPLLLAVAAGHRLAGRRSVDIDDLASEIWVAATPKADDTFLGAWQWADWTPTVGFVTREWTAKLGLVAANLGVTLVPGLAARAVRGDVALVRLRSERPVSREILVATRAESDPVPAVSSFVGLLHESAAELPRG